MYNISIAVFNYTELGHGDIWLIQVERRMKILQYGLSVDSKHNPR